MKKFKWDDDLVHEFMTEFWTLGNADATPQKIAEFKKYKTERIKRLLDDAKVYETIGFGKMIIVAWWATFNKQKSTAFFKNLERGMNAYSAYKYAQLT